MIEGTNLVGATAVKFGGIDAAAFTVNSPTSIAAIVGPGSTGVVSVETPGGVAIREGFTFYPKPTLSTFLPTSAGEGMLVNLTGTNFTGTSSVRFGDIEAESFVVNSSTSISAFVGSGESGSISITNAGGVAEKSGFIFTPPTGVEKEGDNSSLEIYPNPSSGSYVYFLLNRGRTGEPVYVELKDMLGRTIETNVLECRQLVKWDFDIPLSQGLYLITLPHKEKTIIKKIAIN
jgi:hypothetical protein